MKTLTALVFATCFCLFSNLSYCQRKPFMWVNDSIAQERYNKFNAEKLVYISNHLGKPQNNRFYLPNFFDLFSYLQGHYSDFAFLKIYVGVCDSAEIPQGMHNKWIFVFVPCKGDSSEIGDNFILPTPFNPNTIGNFKIKTATREIWVDKFQKALPPVDRIPDNAYHPNPANPSLVEYSDTRYVMYCVGDLNNLELFRTTHASANSLEKNLEGSLGLYPDDGVSLNGELGHFKKRIVLQFSLLGTGSQPFNLSNITNFPSWPRETSVCDTSNNKFAAADIDNGQLCPFHCPN